MRIQALAVIAILLSSTVKADDAYRPDYSIFVEIWKPGAERGVRSELLAKGQRVSGLGSGWTCEYTGALGATAFDPNLSINVISLRCAHGKAAVATTVTCPMTRANLERELARQHSVRILTRLDLSETGSGGRSTGVIIGCELNAPDESPGDAPNQGSTQVPHQQLETRGDTHEGERALPFVMPSQLPEESAPSDEPNYFGLGLTAGGTVTLIESCKEAAARAAAAMSVEAYCDCISDATRRNVGSKTVLVPERDALTKTQARRCVEFAQTVLPGGLAGTPFDRDPIGNSRAIASMVKDCERKKRSETRSWAYTVSYCGCSVDAVRAHGDRIYVVEGENRFCDVVATYWEKRKRHLTPSQVEATKVFSLISARTRPLKSR